MLPSPPARPRFPAPSTATLKVLYQLAYISSGTAIGVGALCAEERRRRTQIVQKIADNARRIRQSPRYARGSHAAAAVREEVEDDYLAEECVRGPELPSVVEREYGKFGGGDVEETRKVRRRSKGTVDGRPRFVKEPEGGRSRSAFLSSGWRTLEPESGDGIRSRNSTRCRRSAKRHSMSGTWSLRPLGSPNLNQQIAFSPSKHVLSDFTAYRREGKHLIRLPQAEAARLAHGIRNRGPPMTTLSDEQAMSEVTARLSLLQGTHKVRGDDEQNQPYPPAEITQNVDEFFKMVSVGYQPVLPFRQAMFTFNHLLNIALKYGSFDDIHALTDWAIATDLLRGNLLVKYGILLGQRTDLKDHNVEVVELVSRLRALETYSKLNSRQRLRFDLDISVFIATLDTNGNEYAMTNTVLTTPKGTNDNLMFTKECEKLLASGRLDACMYVFRSAVYCHSSPASLEQLADVLLDSFLQASRPSLSLQMLRLKWESGFLTNQTRQVETFISMCSHSGSFGILRDAFNGNKESNRLYHGDLHAASYIYLCRAFGEGESARTHTLFRRFLDRLPEEARVAVVEGGIETKVAVLKATWSSSRNLQRARELHQSFTKQSLETIQELQRSLVQGVPGNDASEDTLRPLHLAMVEIYVAASDTDAALHMLSRLNRDEADGTIGALLALTFAKNNDWDSFAKLLQVLHNDKSLLGWNPQSMRAFNIALRLYGEKHTATQTSDLALHAMRELDFKPNIATWRVLLSRAVADKDLRLTIRWLKYRKDQDQPFKVDGELAASLMKTWSVDFRHSHVMVMWLCRTLTLRAPWLAGSEMLDVVKESIGYDLRHLAGGNAALMDPLVRLRETLPPGPAREVPDPGYIRDWKLWHAPGVPLLASRERVESQDYQAIDGADAVMPEETSLQFGSSYGELTELQGCDKTEIQRSSTPDSGLSTAVEQPAKKVLDAAESNAHATSKTFDSEFHDLRPEYSTGQPHEDASKAPRDISDLQTVDRDMILALSIQHYQTTLSLYNASLTATGLPASPLALEVAVEASIRLHGTTTPGLQLLESARSAGMNVSCAMGPILIQQMRQTPTSLLRRSQANKLRLTTLEYYRMNAKNGWNVKHYVGVHAAHTLIRAHRAEHGINLLDAIYHSEWSRDRPLDIAAMSVWLLGYAALQHLEGMRWVVDTVLSRDVRIDMAFLRCLRRAQRPEHVRADGSRVFLKQDTRVAKEVEGWRVVCRVRREEQMKESRVFGKKLVGLLVKAANEDAASGMTIPDIDEVSTYRQRRRARPETGARMRGVRHLASAQSRPVSRARAWVARHPSRRRDGEEEQQTDDYRELLASDVPGAPTREPRANLHDTETVDDPSRSLASAASVEGNGSTWQYRPQLFDVGSTQPLRQPEKHRSLDPFADRIVWGEEADVARKVVRYEVSGTNKDGNHRAFRKV